MKIRSKILLSVLVVTSIAYSFSMGYLILKLRNTSLRDSYQKADLYASESAGLIRSFLNTDMDVSRTMAHTFRFFRKIPQNQRADFFIKMIHGIAVENPNFLSVWGSWEINALDSSYKKPHGRHRYTYYRENGVLKYKEETLNLDGDVLGSGYHNVKLSKRESMIDPYWFAYTENSELLLEASTAVPLIEDGKFMGLFGLDIPLARYQDLTNQIHPFEGSYSVMLSHNGSIVGHPNDELLGKSFAENYPQLDAQHKVSQKVFAGENFSFTMIDSVSGKEFYATFASIPIGKTENPWSFGIFVPSEVILVEAKAISKNSMIISLISLFFLAMIVWFIAHRTTVPLVRTQQVLGELAKGQIDERKKLMVHTGDEVEDISVSLNTLIDGLCKTATFAQEIGKGNLNVSYQTLSNDDVLGESLIEMRESLVQARKQEEIRKIEDEKINWATSGMAKFAEILRKNNDNMEEFTYQVVSNLVRYVHADIGAIFLLNNDKDDDIYFDLAASYAYDRRKFIKKRIEIGEGLVGRCAQEGETIFITEVPNSYIQIVSGLGNDNPSCILIVPLKLNEVVHGVIELASLDVFEKHIIDFVERIGESIASTVATIKINLKTVRLLEESKVKSEELASQEEEMRQNMEELQATQEEAARKTAEMESLIRALNSSSYVIEYDTKGKILSVNDAYLSLTNQRADQMIGSHHSDNLILDEQQLKEYNNFWLELSKGEIKKEKTRVNINDKIFTFIETYSPIFDVSGGVSKILKIAHNITDFLENHQE